ncbi:hypothetical protein D3C80_1483310 [compost metagenome]
MAHIARRWAQRGNRLRNLSCLDCGLADHFGTLHAEVTWIKVEKGVTVEGRAGAVFANLRADIKCRDVWISAGKSFQVSIYSAVSLVWHHCGRFAVHPGNADRFGGTHAVQLREHGNVKRNNHLVAVCGQFGDGLFELCFCRFLQEVQLPGRAQYYSLVLLGLSECTVVECLAGWNEARGHEATQGSDRGASGVRNVADREVTVFGNSFQIADEMRSIGVAPQ